MYCVDMINLFIYKLKNTEETISNIAKQLNISRQTLTKWKNTFYENIQSGKRLSSQDYSKYKQSVERKTKSKIYKNNIIEYVTNNRGCSLKDISKSINCEISNSSICRIIKKNNLTHRRISNRIICKDMDDINKNRKEFIKNMNYKIEDAIFLDEVSFKITDLKRYGYGVKGEEININTRHKHNKETISVISAISIDGIVTKEVVEGCVNKEIYKNFLEKNIKYFENKVIINDNARVHHAKSVKEYAAKSKINLRFNPPYSPEFNPIELSFNKIKCQFRQLDHNNLKDDIEKSFATITSDDCIGFFNKTLQFMQQYL